MNKDFLNSLPADEQPVASKLNSLINDVQLSQTFQWELETKLMDAAQKKTKPAQGWRLKILPALAWTNNCCINADYVQIWTPKETYKSSQIVTPNQFIKMCYEAGVDFTITGQQLYYQYTNRDLADTIRMTERLKKFGKPIQITEIGTTSGPTKETVESGKYEIPNRPYSWHREWDQDLQADWLEQIYTIIYSKQWIEAINWYDFVDPYSFIQNGGLLANPEGEKKEAYPRIIKLKDEWKKRAKK